MAITSAILDAMLQAGAAVPLVTPHVIDFVECPSPLDDLGRAGRPEIIELQAHIIFAQLWAEIETLRNAHPICNTCGGQPCVNPSFCAACRAADQKAVRQRPRSEQSPRPERWPTPQSTIEAVMFCVRERGLKALKEPANIERLRRCDVAAKAQINQHISRLKDCEP